MAELNIIRHDFDSREELAATLARGIAGRLTDGIAARGHATLAVSGGTTPALMFSALAKQTIDWSRVTVTLVDERFVPMDSDRSNAKLVRDKLFVGDVDKAHFLPLYSPDDFAEEAAAAADNLLRQLHLPFDVIVLGMGTDGHTASFFPDAAELEALLDPTTQRLVAAVNADSAGEARLTITLPAIIPARFIALHIEGDSKAEALGRALAQSSRLPVRRVIDAASTPVEIFWAA